LETSWKKHGTWKTLGTCEENRWNSTWKKHGTWKTFGTYLEKKTWKIHGKKITWNFVGFGKKIKLEKRWNQKFRLGILKDK
jgi:hypothetical protein